MIVASGFLDPCHPTNCLSRSLGLYYARAHPTLRGYKMTKSNVKANDELGLDEVNAEQVDNEVLRRALERARKRLDSEIHAKHESHSSHSSHGTAAW